MRICYYRQHTYSLVVTGAGIGGNGTLAIRRCLVPPTHEYTNVISVKRCFRDLRCRVEAATFEGFRLVVKEVDDAVRDFWWEVRVQHRDFGQEATLGAG